MPDAIALPGIDSAAPAPAATPAPAAPSQPAQQQHADPQPRDNSQGPEATPEPPAQRRDDAGDQDDDGGAGERRPGRRNRGNNQRIQELVAESRRKDELLERTLIALAGRNGAAPADAQPAASADPEPKSDDFTSYNEYTRAVARWEARQENRRLQAEAQQQAAREHGERSQRVQQETFTRAVGAMQADLGQQMHAAVQRFPDYLDAVESSTYDVPIPLQGVIASSDDPGGVAYYLCKNEDVARQLANLPPVKAAHYVARIAHAMKSGGATSNAPAPGRPGASRGTSGTSYPENATPEQHLEWEKRQAGAR